MELETVKFYKLDSKVICCFLSYVECKFKCVCVCISVCAHAGVQEYVHISINHQIVKENIRGEKTMIEEGKGKNLSNLSTWIRMGVSRGQVGQEEQEKAGGRR